VTVGVKRCDPKRILLSQGRGFELESNDDDVAVGSYGDTVRKKAHTGARGKSNGPVVAAVGVVLRKDSEWLYRTCSMEVARERSASEIDVTGTASYHHDCVVWRDCRHPLAREERLGRVEVDGGDCKDPR